MQLLILKTSVKTAEAANGISPLLDLHPGIHRWNIDTEDIDNVLRIESEANVSEDHIVQLLGQYGVYSEPLAD